MPSVVLDTHAAMWYLEGSARLSHGALAAIQAALSAGETVYVSTVTLVEIIYLVEKGRIPATLLDRMLVELRRPSPELTVAPFDLGAADMLRSVPARIIRDMPDRMIAATAVTLGLPLVTRDQKIRASNIAVIW